MFNANVSILVDVAAPLIHVPFVPAVIVDISFWLATVLTKPPKIISQNKSELHDPTVSQCAKKKNGLPAFVPFEFDSMLAN